MSRTSKITLGIFLLLLMLLTYLEASEPQPLNWSPSYAAGDKIPLGTFVLFENLQEQDFPLQEVNQPPYEYLENNILKGTYFFINNQLSFDDNELNKLLKWTAEGNTLFLSAEGFSENLLDTLGLETAALIPEEGFSFKPLLNLAHPQLQKETPYLFDHESYLPVFTENDSSQYQVLGFAEFYTDTLRMTEENPNYIRRKLGEGEILLHLTPKAFSNFFLLADGNATYAEKALAYLPGNNTLYWDNYYKTGKAFYTSPLYILLNNKALKWAYYFVLIGCLLFIIFEGKRKQRSIPVIKPLQNQTYHFTRAIAGLYLDRKDYKKIATKKISLFLEFIRLRLRIPTAVINDDFYRKLASASEHSEEEVKSLFRLISNTEQKDTLSKDELLQLNSSIENFKKNK